MKLINVINIDKNKTYFLLTTNQLLLIYRKVLSIKKRNICTSKISVSIYLFIQSSNDCTFDFNLLICFRRVFKRFLCSTNCKSKHPLAWSRKVFFTISYSCSQIVLVTETDFL